MKLPYPKDCIMISLSLTLAVMAFFAAKNYSIQYDPGDTGMILGFMAFWIAITLLVHKDAPVWLFGKLGIKLDRYSYDCRARHRLERY